MFNWLKVPLTSKGILQVKKMTPEEEAEAKKRFAIELMRKIVKETHGKKSDYTAECKYYLELHSYNLDAALTEFEADMAFEREYEAE